MSIGGSSRREQGSRGENEKRGKGRGEKRRVVVPSARLLLFPTAISEWVGIDSNSGTLLNYLGAPDLALHAAASGENHPDLAFFIVDNDVSLDNRAVGDPDFEG